MTEALAGNVPIARTNVLTREREAAQRDVATTYRPDVDGLRALSLMAAIGYHAFPHTVRSGFTGPEVFFVISGYLITGLILKDLERAKFSIITFYARRVRRIFPSLVVILAACLVAGWFLLLPSEYAQLGKNILGGASFSANFVSWAEVGYFDHAAESKPLLHLWSLAVEEQFYLIWPLMLVLAFSFKRGPLKIILGFATASFVLSVVSIFWGESGSYFSPFIRFWELLTGALLAYAVRPASQFAAMPSMAPWLSLRSKLRERFTDTQIRDGVAALGLFLLWLSIFKLNRNGPYPGIQAIVPVLATVLLIWVGNTTWINKKFLASPLLVHLGKISFPFYLWHWPLFSFARINSEGRPSAATYWVLIFVGWGLAFLTYKFAEKPMRFGRALRAKSLSLCAAIVVLGGAGLAVNLDDGVPSKVPEELGRIVNFHFNFLKVYRTRDCMLWTDQGPSEFGKDCAVTTGGPITRRIALWGDSHAAHLLPGLEDNLAHGVQLTQLTAGACPPIPGYDTMFNKYCRDVNDYVLARIKKEKPDTVILAAAWLDYQYLFPWSKVADIVAELKRDGVRSIFVIGPVPKWKNDLRYCLSRAFAIRRSVPTRLSNCLEPGSWAVDQDLRQALAGTGAAYVSALDTLCNRDGCLTQLGQGGETLTTLDQAHLMPVASDYLVSHFPPDLLSATPPH